MPIPGLTTPPDDAVVDSVAHVVQIALTPVFLLNGIGTLIALFNTRVARVSDQIQHVTELLAGHTDEIEMRELEAALRRLARRIFILDASVALGAIGGASTCGSVFVLFVGGVRGSGITGWLFGLFGLALACTIGSLIAFLIDSLLAWHGLRREGPIPRSTKASRS